MVRILIKNGRIWDGEKFFFADVLTEGEKIAKIQPKISDPAEFVYDAKDQIVSTGLVDLHVHMKGIASEKYGMQAEMGSFPFAVTAANDAGSVHGDRRMLDRLSVKNTVFAGTNIKSNHIDTAYTDALLQKYGDKAVGVKIYFDTTISEVSDITPLAELCDYAREKKLKVMVHCSHSPTTMKEIVQTLSAGDILTHIYHGGENNCTENNFEALRFAKQKGVILDTGFAGHVHTDFANLENATATVILPDTISTDITKRSAFVRGGRYGITMCMNIAKTVGMSDEDIFRTVTSSPAKVLGKENEWGYLKEGRCADIAVFDYTDEGFDLTDNAGNHICDTEGYRCVLTISDGQIVYRN